MLVAPARSGEGAARDEPNTKPNPLATLQVSVPTATPDCAVACAPSPKEPPSAATKAAASRIVLYISQILLADVRRVSDADGVDLVAPVLGVFRPAL